LDGVVWCNPPYGRGLGNWVRKAFEASENGTTVVMLLPAYMGNAWFLDYVIPHGEVIPIRGSIAVRRGAISGAVFERDCHLQP
jgi:hypothetical protein